MPYTPDANYGRAGFDAIASQLPVLGRILVVLNSSNSSNENYQRMWQTFKTDTYGDVHFFNTLEDAYAAAQSNNNDVIVLDANSTHSVSTMLTWSKNRVHLIGFDGGGRLVQQGAKVELSGNVAVAAVLKVTGTRNSFRNIKFIQSSTNAAALNVVQFAGEGNYYENCSFVFGVNSNLDENETSEALFGEDSGTLVRCSFGSDVLLSSAARSVFLMDAISGASSADGAKSNRLIDCEFFIMSSTANATLVKLADTAGAKFLNRFVRPSFVAVKNTSNSAIAITNAIASAAGFVEGSLVFEYPTTANCTNGCAGVADNVVVSAPASSANAWEGQTPS